MNTSIGALHQEYSREPPNSSLDFQAFVDWFLRIFLYLFLFACVFDPADRLLGLKVYLFLLCWLIVVLELLSHPNRWRLHVGLAIYILVFMFIPSVSIAWYWIVDGSDPFEGFQLLKGYLLIGLSALLFLRNIDLVPKLSMVLTCLAMAVYATGILLLTEPALFPALYLFGGSTGMFVLDNREYGSELTLMQIYFVTSPMLVIAIAYYFHMMRSAVGSVNRAWYAMLVAVNVTAMMLAGTRANIFIATLLPMVLVFMYSKHKVLNATLCGLVLISLISVFIDEIRVVLDPREFSNNIKLALLRDYGQIFADPVNLLFGQGLGAYEYWTAKGVSFYISELTYLELVRNFGIFGALAMALLLVFPLAYAFVIRPSYHQRHIVIAYGFYLVMCAANPNLFSSMGILILAVVLANVFQDDSRQRLSN